VFTARYEPNIHYTSENSKAQKPKKNATFLIGKHLTDICFALVFREMTRLQMAHSLTQRTDFTKAFYTVRTSPCFTVHVYL